MKFLLLITVVLLSLNALAQEDWAQIDFDDSTYLNYIHIDSISNRDNIWQVGDPDKIHFTEAGSLPNAIVTDTVSPYPINDTSTFIISYKIENLPGAHLQYTNLQFWFRIDSDIDSDFGYIEFSPDNGQSWFSYKTDTLNWCSDVDYRYYTGYTEDWSFATCYNYYSCYEISQGDTIMYRFTFISDSVDSGKDGWMIDNITLYDIFENIVDHNKSVYFNIYPNPTNGRVLISPQHSQGFDQINIYNQIGQLVKKTTLINNSINLSDLNEGIYYIGLTTDEGEITRKVVLRY